MFFNHSAGSRILKHFSRIIMSQGNDRVYYAVGCGRQRGVYNSWKECKIQVEGIPNAKFRKFSTFEEAQKFVDTWRNLSTDVTESINSRTNQNEIENGSSQSKTCSVRNEEELMEINEDFEWHRKLDQQSMGQNTPSKCLSSSSFFHIGQDSKNVEVAALNLRLDAFEKRFDVCLKEIGGIFAELTHIKASIKEMRESMKSVNALGRGTVTSDNSEIEKQSSCCQCKRGNGNLPVCVVSSQSSSSSLSSYFSRPHSNSSEVNGDEPSSKKAKLMQTNSSKTDIDLSENIDLSKVKMTNIRLSSFIVDADDYVTVYTDGACVDNGKKEARAGIGIWFGDDHPMNTGERVKGPQTNNTAEIQAARVAIQLAIEAGLKKLRIHTDSEFLINCATKWIHKWKKNCWSLVDGGEVKNRKELEKLDWFASKISVRWAKVEAHSGVKGNEEADRLAKEGALKCPR